MTNQEIRTLTAEQLDAVAGGMTAIFQSGGFSAVITAGQGGYIACTNFGDGNKCTGYLPPGNHTLVVGAGGVRF